jgi:hypothetical protein
LEVLDVGVQDAAQPALIADDDVIILDRDQGAWIAFKYSADLGEDRYRLGPHDASCPDELRRDESAKMALTQLEEPVGRCDDREARAGCPLRSERSQAAKSGTQATAHPEAQP